MPELYLATGHSAGEECSSTYEGRHLTFEESIITHPEHLADGFVDGGDPVLIGENIIGVAFESAAAATDLIAIDTEGIWFLNATATDEGGNSAIAAGDELYIHKTTAIISKERNQATHARYGYALGDVGAGLTAVVAVKVHWDPDVAENDMVQAKEVTFTETAGAGVYTGSVNVPAGATIEDIVVHAVALWDPATSATLKVGDVADDDGFYVDVNLMAADLLAAESISFDHAGGQQGADLDVADGHVRRRYLVGARIVSGIITVVGAAGTAGRTRMTVYYSIPTTIIAATKV